MGQENDGGRRGNAIPSFWGQSSWAGEGKLGKIHQFIKMFFFSADLQTEIKSFDAAINHPIAEVLPGGTREQRGVQGIIVTYYELLPLAVNCNCKTTATIQVGA